MTSEQRQMLLKRLRELQAGAEPYSRTCGICNDLKMTGLGHFAYNFMADTMEVLHIDFEAPFGYESVSADKWVGHTGVRRRALAGQVADWLEEQV